MTPIFSGQQFLELFLHHIPWYQGIVSWYEFRSWNWKYQIKKKIKKSILMYYHSKKFILRCDIKAITSWYNPMISWNLSVTYIVPMISWDPKKKSLWKNYWPQSSDVGDIFWISVIKLGKQDLKRTNMSKPFFFSYPRQWVETHEKAHAWCGKIAYTRGNYLGFSVLRSWVENRVVSQVTSVCSMIQPSLARFFYSVYFW